MKIIVLETEIAGGEVMKEMAAMFSLTANYQVLGSFSLPWAFCYSFFSHTKQQLSKEERFWWKFLTHIKKQHVKEESSPAAILRIELLNQIHFIM